MAETSRLVGPILKFFFPDLPPETLYIYHGYVRKTAHFTEYAVLAFLTQRSVSRSASTTLLKLRYLIPLFLVAGIAILDEFNQSFEASRTGSPWDVLLDISGGTAMIVILWLFKWPRGAQAKDVISAEPE